MTDLTVSLWFYFATLIFVMLLASYLCGKRLAKIISLADGMADAIKAWEQESRPIYIGEITSL